MPVILCLAPQNYTHFEDYIDPDLFQSSPPELVMVGMKRNEIHVGDAVDIVLKKDQPTGKLTRGIVKEILTSSSSHPHGIKVKLNDGKVGRVKAVIPKKDENHP